MNRWIAGALGLTLLSTSAQAATVTLEPEASVLRVGDTLVLVADNDGFATATGGADLELYWDPAVVRVDWLKPVLPGFDYVTPGTPSAAEQADGEIELISLLAPLVATLPSGDFDSLQIGLTAVGPGTTYVTLSGVWYNKDASETIPVEFFPATVTVVPLPAAAWALLGALGVLGGLRRRRG